MRDTNLLQRSNIGSHGGRTAREHPARGVEPRNRAETHWVKPDIRKTNAAGITLISFDKFVQFGHTMLEALRSIDPPLGIVVPRKPDVTPPIQIGMPSDKVGRANFLFSFIEHVDRNNGHALYFQAEIKLKEGTEETARHFFYRYIEAEEELGQAAKGGTSAEICYERAHGYCRQRTGWVHHQLSASLFREAERLNKDERQRELLSRALNHANSAMQHFPGGFEQRPSTQWLLTDLESRIRQGQTASMTAGRFAPSWPR